MSRFRFSLARLLMCAGFAAVLLRLGYLQIWCHAELAQRANDQSQRLVQPAPRRGPLLDREGRVLVSSVRVASCYADPHLLRQVDKVAHLLSGPLGLPAGTLAQKIRNTPGSFVWLKRFLPVEQAQAVERLNLFGIGLKWEYRRDYSNGELASHLLGLVGTDGHGLSGVEQVLDEWLVDRRPARRAFRDGRGTGVSDGSDIDEEADRSSARLTLDRTLQYIAERELDEGLRRSRSRRGIIIVQDPHTGEVLAMASRPSLSLSDEKPDDPDALHIPGIHYTFEPGSTMKAFTAAAALEEGLVSPGDLVNCENGQWAYADLKIHDHEKEGVLTFAQVIERSSNIGTAKVGLRLGKVKLYDYYRAFGFGSRTGSEIPGESGGLLKPLAKWSGVTLPIMSFGQEVGVSALQLACAYSALANGGELLEPRLFQEVTNAQGETRRWVTPSMVRRVISPKTAGVLTKILQGVVDRGTGKPAYLDAWTIAGKTGTAQKVDPRTKLYSPDKFIASFCGFVPATRPRLTIVVVYDEPQGVSWGGYNAGPVFKNVAWQALTKLAVPPDRETRVASRSGGRGKKPLKTL